MITENKISQSKSTLKKKSLSKFFMNFQFTSIGEFFKILFNKLSNLMSSVRIILYCIYIGFSIPYPSLSVITGSLPAI